MQATFQTRKEHLIKCLFNKVLTISLYRQDVDLITSKAFRSSRSQMFYKIGVLENFVKFTRKHLCWSHFLIKLHTCFPIIFVKFSRTSIFQSPLNQTTLLSKQISKVTKRRQSHVCSLVLYKTSSGLSFHFFSKSRSRILDELRVSFKKIIDMFFSKGMFYNSIE